MKMIADKPTPAPLPRVEPEVEPKVEPEVEPPKSAPRRRPPQKSRPEKEGMEELIGLLALVETVLQRKQFYNPDGSMKIMALQIARAMAAVREAYL